MDERRISTAADIFYNVTDVMSMLDYSRSKAYKIIASLNKELEGKGFLTRPGLVSKRYFNDRYFGLEPAPAKARGTRSV